jgi:hypothetical protein
MITYNIYKTNDIAKKQLKSQYEPIIVINVRENDHENRIIDLIIENVGPGIAKNIQFKVSPHGFITLSGYPLEKLFLFQKILKIFPSKQKYVIHLTDFPEKIHEIKQKYKIMESTELIKKIEEETTLVFSVTYEDKDGEKKADTFELNLSIFWGLSYPL